MSIPMERIKPMKEGVHSRVFLALFLRDIADTEAGKATGTNDPAHVPSVWLHISDPMLKAPHFTGEEGFQGASERARMILRELLPKAESFLAAPHIFDVFKDHGQRRDWSDKFIVNNPDIKDGKLRQDLLHFFKKNKLSMNNFQALQSGFSMLARDVKDLDCEEARYVAWVVQHMGEKGALPSLEKLSGRGTKVSYDPPPTYDQLTLEQKWEYAHAFEIVCMNLLEKVADSEHLQVEKEFLQKTA